jgi:hypothetical protein
MLSCLSGWFKLSLREFLVPIDDFVSAPMIWVVFLLARMLARKVEMSVLN